MTAGSPERAGFDLRRFLLSGSGWPYLLVPFIPIAITLELAHASAAAIFQPCMRCWGSPSSSSDGRAAARVLLRAAAVAETREADLRREQKAAPLPRDR
jgi:hypothetical protein